MLSPHRVPLLGSYFLWLLGVAATAGADEGLVRLQEREVLRAVASRVEPEYPAMARQVRLSGAVDVEVVIDEAGAVEKTRVLAGNLLLSNSAVRAVKKWRFTPFSAGGKPSRVITVLRFDFKM